MTRSTYIALGAGAAILVVGGLIMASGSSNPAGKQAAPSPGPKVGRPGVQGLKPPAPKPPLAVSKTDCGIVISDLEAAKKLAYELGRTSRDIEAAKTQLYRAGQCGVTKPLRPVKAQMRNSYWVTYELLRGAIANPKGELLSKAEAELAMQDLLFQVALAGVETSDLPSEMP